MKAIRIEEYGGPETLRLRNLELPGHGPGEVYVNLRAAGLKQRARSDCEHEGMTKEFANLNHNVAGVALHIVWVMGAY